MSWGNQFLWRTLFCYRYYSSFQQPRLFLGGLHSNNDSNNNNVIIMWPSLYSTHHGFVEEPWKRKRLRRSLPMLHLPTRKRCRLSAPAAAAALNVGPISLFEKSNDDGHRILFWIWLIHHRRRRCGVVRAIQNFPMIYDLSLWNAETN